MERKVTTARTRSVLEGMLSDETAEPMALQLSLLEDITGGFSDDQEIGSGGFAVVYKGILDDRVVAVKRLSRAYIHEKEFHREVECLMRVKHKNIVRFLGYCSDTQVNMERFDGKHVRAKWKQRLLCFEYMPKGSLDKYITDASLEWETCYKIIKGICEGLLYLHENRIVHMDLKPANILLDDNMVPKIADFGLSRCFEENQSQNITKNIAATVGYLAPEFRERGVIARSSDLYSLGVIIMEILTGQKGYQAIGVLESWNDRLERSQGDTQRQQIRECYQIGIECIEAVPEKRPSARKIINRLHKMESTQTAEAAAYFSGVAVVPESKGKSYNGQPSVFCSVPSQTAEASASTSGGATTMTEPKGKSNTDQHKMFRSVPGPGSGARGGEGSGEPRRAMLHAMAVPPSPAGKRAIMLRPAGPVAAAAPGSAYGLLEAKPPLPAMLGPRAVVAAATKMASTYDMVESMSYLYVSVVRARDVPTMDMTGALDTYVEVKLGNFKGVTNHLEKNPNPVWRQVFAFSRDHLQSNQLEVIVMDKDVLKDDFVGRVLFKMSDIPSRLPSDSPLVPQWYRLVDRSGEKLRHGEIMLSVWLGIQADEAFQEAWHSDAHSLFHDGLNNTRSKVYYSPELTYLKVVAISAQDLVPAERGRPLAPTIAKIQLGGQIHQTRPWQQQGSVNPSWNEEFIFLSSEPFEDPLVVTVEERVGPGHDELMGRVIIPVAAPYVPRNDLAKPVPPKWFSMSRGMTVDEAVADVTDNKEEESKTFTSKIHLRLSLETAYHVLDESTHYSSDLQPSAKKLRKSAIGILEVGILSARNLVPMNARRLMHPYCVAKYGEKWLRTRTLLNTVVPHWNEQHTWQVFDISTVITIAVFDNCHLFHGDDDAEDQRIGKVRIRLATLETNHVYMHYYPLMELNPSGLKKTGELQLAVYFTCTAWVNMLAMYGKPLLPKMHYTNPISATQVNYLRFQAMQMVATRLERAEPPLRREVVEYMLDVDSHMFSMRRSKANYYRLFSVATAAANWFDGIRKWKNPVVTILVHLVFLVLVCFPELILPTVFLDLFFTGALNYLWRVQKPSHMDTVLSLAEQVDPDELDEEFDTFPTSRPDDIVRMRYERLRSLAEKVQNAVGELATKGERVQSLVSWRDPRMTAIFLTLLLAAAVILFVTPFRMVVMVVGLYLLRHPLLRSNLAVNLYSRLPSNDDVILH